jgi:hypothetical protein
MTGHKAEIVLSVIILQDNNVLNCAGMSVVVTIHRNCRSGDTLPDSLFCFVQAGSYVSLSTLMNHKGNIKRRTIKAYERSRVKAPRILNLGIRWI